MALDFSVGPSLAHFRPQPPLLLLSAPATATITPPKTDMLQKVTLFSYNCLITILSL